MGVIIESDPSYMVVGLQFNKTAGEDDQSLDLKGQSSHRPSPLQYEQSPKPVGGLIIACPHSGRFYPPELLEASRLDQLTLRRSEDAFVDILFNKAPSLGADLLVSTFARAFVDLNRSPGELDPQLIRDVLPSNLEAHSDRVKAGLGVIPRTVGEGMAIYKTQLDRHVAEARLTEIHGPWHQFIETCITRAVQRNGAAVLVDCHSMPTKASGNPSCDIVLGDRFGASCAPLVMNEAYNYFRNAGLKVVRNIPYAGGYTTRRHGQTSKHHHVLQIEINRSLYMVEGALTLRPEFQSVQDIMSGFILRLAEVSVLLCRRTSVVSNNGQRFGLKSGF